MGNISEQIEYVPDSLKDTELAKKVEELKELGLTMGHGFTSRQWKLEDLKELRQLVTEISLQLDKHIGIKDGEWGRW
jgi:hypothetical protein